MWPEPKYSLSTKKPIVFHPTVCSTACSSPDHTCVSLQRCANFTITFLPLIQVNSLIALKSDGRKETVSDEQGRTGIHVSGPGSLLFKQPQLPVSLTVISKVLAQSRRAKINLQTARTPKSLHFNYTHLTREINKNGRKKKKKHIAKCFHEIMFSELLFPNNML